MKTVYLTEKQIRLLQEKKEEITFYEFVIGIKSFLKDLLKKPADATPSDLFTRNHISKKELLNKMTDLGLIKRTDRIDEVPIEEDKQVAKRYVTYKVPKSRFKEKVKELYKDLFVESQRVQVFKDNDELIQNILDMDTDNAYKARGGYDQSLVKEDGLGGGGASSCSSVMQAGGGNPSAGQYDTVFGGVQDRDFWHPAQTRNKDKKNKSISMNRK